MCVQSDVSKIVSTAESERNTYAGVRAFFVPGGVNPGSLFVVPAAVQQERASVPSYLYADCDARNEGVRRAGCNKRFYLHPFHGHEIHPHRQKVSIITLIVITQLSSTIQILIFVIITKFYILHFGIALKTSQNLI